MMSYELMSSIGNCIDNVYAYASESPERKTVATLSDNVMNIRYVTIIRAGKDLDLQMQMSLLQSEAKQMISSRLKSIKEEFKKCSSSTLKTKKCGETSDIETLTVSPYSPIRTLKVNITYCYEVSC